MATTRRCFCGVTASAGSPKTAIEAGFHFAEPDGPGITGHDVDLARAGAVTSRDDGISEAFELLTSERLSLVTEALARKRHVASSCNSGSEPSAISLQLSAR